MKVVIRNPSLPILLFAIMLDMRVSKAKPRKGPQRAEQGRQDGAVQLSPTGSDRLPDFLPKH